MSICRGQRTSYFWCVVLPPVIGSQFIVGPKRSGNVLLFKQEELQGPHPRSLILQQMHGSPLAAIVSNSSSMRSRVVHQPRTVSSSPTRYSRSGDRENV